jgi:phospholipid/cholesterol/gamma-HCH transport system substrate-binding protein
MRPARSELAVGITILASLAVFLGTTLRLGGCSFVERPGAHIAARFDDAAGVEARSPVLIAGVRVGEVERVELEAGRARLVLRIDPGRAEVPIDSTVAIRSRGLLGERVVEIVPGGSDHLAASGDTLTRTLEAPDLDRLLDSLALVSEDIREVTRSLRLVLGGPEGEENLAGMVDDLRAVSRGVRALVEENDERLANVMLNLESFSSDLARISEDNGQTLSDLLQNFAQTSVRMQEAVESLAVVSARVERGEGTLGKLVSDEKLYAEARASLEDLRLALREVRRAAEEAQEQLPVTVLGSVVGTLF